MKLANKGTSELLTAECIQNWSETVVVDNGRQDLRSKTLLWDTKQVLEDEIHLVMSEQLIVQMEENLNYTMTETRKEHKSVALATSKKTSELCSLNG